MHKTLGAALTVLLDNGLSRDATREALDRFAVLFADGPDALGPSMAGQAEEGVGEPEQVAVAVSLLADDLLTSLKTRE